MFFFFEKRLSTFVVFFMCNYPITQIYTTASCSKLPDHQFSPVNHTMHQNPSQAKYKTPSFESVFKLTPSAKLSQARPNIQSAPAPAPSTTCIDNLVNLCHQPFGPILISPAQGLSLSSQKSSPPV